MRAKKEPTGWQILKDPEEWKKAIQERMGKRKSEEEEKQPSKMTDISAAVSNVNSAVLSFCDRWIPLPTMTPPCEVVDQGQLRDMLGLIPTIDLGDPWPQAEEMLLNEGFRWHQMGNSRVMFLREKDDCLSEDGWEEVES